MGTARPRSPARLRIVVLGASAALAACQGRLPPRLDPPPLPDGVTADVRGTTYPVSGYSVRGLDASVRANGPQWDGAHVWGLVRWRVRWNGRPVERDGACRLEDVKVLVTVDITLPEWPGARLGARDLRLRWEDFLASLRVHEYGHRDRAFLAGAEVHGTLLGVRAESCLTIAQLADARALAVVRRHEELDRAYDRISLHGRTQGAVWPPSGP